MMTKKVDTTTFVKTWTLASSLVEAADRLGVTTIYAQSFAARLRKAGVRLKKFSNVDSMALNKLIAELA